jgi:dTDP-4-dehydrorhamnose 3,5-epimerase
MKVLPTRVPGVMLIEPSILADFRGWFFESFHADRYQAAGVGGPFVQDNVSRSRRGVLRGLHFQHPHGQRKLVSVLAGEVFDVAVDVRVGSPTFGKWTGEVLSAENGRQLFIPEGFAHGFLTLSDEALFAYKCSEYYRPEAERVLLWSDSEVGIDWPMAFCPDGPTLSVKDGHGRYLNELSFEMLPDRPQLVSVGSASL